MAQDKHGAKITIRLSKAELARLQSAMTTRGIAKISDFVRQAIAGEFLRMDDAEQIRQVRQAAQIEAVEAECAKLRG